MPAPMAPARAVRPARAAAVVAAATLLLSAVPPAAAAPRPGKGVELPVMPALLPDGEPCTAASRKQAEAAPWAQQQLDLSRVHRRADGAGVTVAVVDTGVAPGTRTLAGRVSAPGTGGRDCVGHGSFVAGLVAAAPTDDVRFTGVAPAAEVLGVRGTGERGKPDATAVATAIRKAAQAGAEVITVSAALPVKSGELSAAVADAQRQDAVVVAAAVPDPPAQGADEPPPPRDYWPAAAPGVLSAVDSDASGSRPEGVLSPKDADLAAPGSGVVSNGPRGTGHFIGSGASLAAGYVAGTAALVRSEHPGLSAREVADRLTSTAYPASVPRLAPYAAVTSVGGEPGAAAEDKGHAEAVQLRDTTHADRATSRALLLASGGVALLLALAWAAVVLPRGRARRWRPDPVGGSVRAGGAPDSGRRES